ncbi:MAG: hypothetical protein K2X47_06580 [Bdellovibrionales bacterium]|nr:hypothetical protein [Bdellovibrionales bacterium]
MNEPLISFLLIDTAKNSLSKFESSQAEITAFFQKLLVPMSVHRIQSAQDAPNLIRASAAKVFAIVDSPVCFPLTHLLTYLQAFLNNPAPEDLFFLVWDNKNTVDPFLAKEGGGSRMTPVTPSFLEGIAVSTLSPPHTAFPMECFPPLVVMTSQFAKKYCRESSSQAGAKSSSLTDEAKSIFAQNPLWLRLALNLYAHGHSEIRSRREVLEGKMRPWNLSDFGFAKTACAWWDFQRLISKARGWKSLG